MLDTRQDYSAGTQHERALTLGIMNFGNLKGIFVSKNDLPGEIEVRFICTLTGRK